MVVIFRLVVIFQLYSDPEILHHKFVLKAHILSLQDAIIIRSMFFFFLYFLKLSTGKGLLFSSTYSSQEKATSLL
jgi:hypothetical protein